ncbi:NB-ARC domain-containing protein [Streptomyces sp. NPDC005322]|uniref:ATP-binding protein n=2 Tax=Streptomyces TaxID=1883 RepID=UPI0033A6EE97
MLNRSAEAEGGGPDERGRGAGPPAGARNELSGTVTGPSVQAGTVYGGIHIGKHGTPVERVPWQLPPAVRLANRTRELAALEDCRDRAARHGHPVLAAVSGLGGVGKTVLALSWLRSLRAHFPDGQLYAGLGAQSPGGTPADPMEILSRFLRALGVPPRQIPAAMDERTDLYRSLTAERRLVVLLDDAATAAQARPLLPGGRNVAVVTSRWRLPGLSVDGCYPVHLEPLDPDAAVELLAFTLADDRVRAQPDDARALVELCSGLPLAVRVAGARLAARPRRPITVMVRALAHEHDRLEGLAIEGDRGVRAALDLSYGGLAPDAARLYRLLSLHPGPDFTGEVATAALGVADDAAGEVARLIDVLYDANLIGETGDERYRFHDLVRLHAAALAETVDGEPSCRAATRRIFDHYLASATRAEEILDPHHRSLGRTYGDDPPVVKDFEGGGGDIADTALSWLDGELLNLMAVLKSARRTGYPGVTWQLADAMWSLFMRRKHYEEWRTAHEEGAEAARESGDTAAECRMLTSGAMGELDTGNHARALEMFERAAGLFEREGDELGFARTLNYRGLAYQGLGRLSEAAELFTRAAEELPRCGDPRAAGLARFNLAEVALAGRRYEAGIGDARAARHALQEAGDPYNAARAARVLGRLQLGLGDLDAAEEWLNEALTDLRGVSDFETARTVEVLAELAERRGERGLADERYREALVLYGTLGLPSAVAAVRARLGGGVTGSGE